MQSRMDKYQVSTKKYERTKKILSYMKMYMMIFTVIPLIKTWKLLTLQKKLT